ncbi:hypothetical protein VT84_06770 [Gemmata sp. SH-PL17]|nr:hypothetical protein VT84_06770 [Gemmata sp. SH-PL17]
MISQERVLAEYAFYHAFESHTNQILDKECHECAAAARMELEPLYQHFKLADSPETARLLIRYVEEQGGHQGTRTANPARD